MNRNEYKNAIADVLADARKELSDVSFLALLYLVSGVTRREFDCNVEKHDHPDDLVERLDDIIDRHINKLGIEL